MKAVCQICGKKLHFINQLHLNIHGISLRDYRTKFPNNELYSDELKEKRKQFLINENPMSKQETRKKVSKNIREHYKNNPSLREKLSRLIIKRNTGRTYPEHHKRAISDALMGHGFSEETLMKMRKPHPTMIGIGNPNWRGGKSFEFYGVGFNNKLRNEIRERDNHSCMLCGISQEKLKYKLDVHHVDYDKTNNSPSNLISLCKPCHGKTHYNRQKWLKSLRVLIHNRRETSAVQWGK